MSDGKIQLRWKSYQADMRALFQRLRRSEELTDVLLTNGTISIKCHRVILSSACQTFYDLLKTHAGDVVICLGDVPCDDLTSLVDFMYSGEADVPQGRLNEFLSLACQWGVRGLGHGRSDNEPQTPDAPDSASAPELTADEGLPRRAEMALSAAANVSISRQSEPAAGESISRRQGRPQPDDSDSSSGAILSVINPNTGKKNKKRSTSAPAAPSPDRSTEKPTSSAAKSPKKTKSPKTSSTAKSHRLETSQSNVPNMYACPHCPRVFVKLYYFTLHKKSQHNDCTPPDRDRVRFSAGTGRTMKLAGSMVTLKMPATKKKKTEDELGKKKKADEEEQLGKKKKKKAEKGLGKKAKKRRDRAEAAAAAVAAADEAIAIALAEAAASANPPRVQHPERTQTAPVSAQKAPSPARPTRVQSSSSSDSDSDSSVEVTLVARGGAAAARAAAAAAVVTPAVPARLPPLTQPLQPPQPPVVTRSRIEPLTPPPPVTQPPQPSRPPVVSRSRIELLRLHPQRIAEDACGPSRIVFDPDGHPRPPADATALAPQENRKPTAIPPLLEPQPPAAEPTRDSAAEDQHRRAEERRRLLAWPQNRAERQRLDSLGSAGESSRGTRIVFDQEGRARPADRSPSMPPAAPPVGIATHVRRGPTAHRDSDPGDSRERRDWERDGDRGRGDRHQDHRWDRERDRRDVDDRRDARDGVWRERDDGRRDREGDRRDDRGGSHRTSDSRRDRDQEDGWRDREDGRRDWEDAVSPHEAKRRRVASGPADVPSGVDDSAGGGDECDIFWDRDGSRPRGGGWRGLRRGRGRGRGGHRGRGRGGGIDRGYDHRWDASQNYDPDSWDTSQEREHGVGAEQGPKRGSRKKRGWGRGRGGPTVGAEPGPQRGTGKKGRGGGGNIWVRDELSGFEGYQ